MNDDDRIVLLFVLGALMCVAAVALTFGPVAALGLAGTGMVLLAVRAA